MEKISPKMAGAFGVGFLGFIMAAYSYNKHHKPEYADNLVKNFSEDTDEERDDENNDAVDAADAAGRALGACLPTINRSPHRAACSTTYPSTE